MRDKRCYELSFELPLANWRTIQGHIRHAWEDDWKIVLQIQMQKWLPIKDKKLSYRRETARQLRTYT